MNPALKRSLAKDWPSSYKELQRRTMLADLSRPPDQITREELDLELLNQLIFDKTVELKTLLDLHVEFEGAPFPAKTAELVSDTTGRLLSYSAKEYLAATDPEPCPPQPAEPLYKESSGFLWNFLSWF